MFPEKKTEEEKAEEEKKAVAAVSHQQRPRNRLDDIILQDEEKPRFHLRYVVYTLGLIVGFNFAYKNHTGFRYACDSVAMSYRCGRLVQDFREMMFNTFFSDNSRFKNWCQSIFYHAGNKLSRLLDRSVVCKKQTYVTN